MANLDEALAFANYQATLNRERQLINQRFQDNCVLAYNGGLFKISSELLGALKCTQYSWMLDMNNNPIEIPDSDAFFNLANTQYTAAINEYGTAYKQLKTKRSVKNLVGL